MIAYEAMRGGLICLCPRDTMACASAIMKDCGISVLPVVEGEDVCVVGVIRLHEVLLANSTNSTKQPVNEFKVSWSDKVVYSTDDVKEVIRIMIDCHQTSVPVINTDGSLVGHIYYLDLLKYNLGLDMNFVIKVHGEHWG